MPNLVIRLVSKVEGPRFAAMVQHEPYRSILAEQKPFKGVLIPVGLFDDERPMAILLGHILPGENYCLLAGLGADISLMGKGLEKRMEAYLAEKCLGLNIKELRFIYDSDSPGAPVINELLDQCGYSPPEPELLVCRCDKRLANLALMGYTELPAGLDTVNWLQLADEKREAFRTLLPSFPWFEPRLSPFLNDAHICPEPSLAMMKGEEIVGWAICHQTDSDTIDYTTIEIFPEYQGVGTGIALQMRSIRRHLLTELADRFPYGRFVASYKDHARLRVLKKKFLPHAADWHDRMLRTRKL